MTRYLAVLCVRNEAAFLIDWLAHHRAVGFTDFLVFSNDCDDGTDALLDRLDKAGIVTHIRHDGPHEGGVQWAAMKLADKHPLGKSADWIMALDIDEFVNIHVGSHRLDDLIRQLPEADAITLTWRLFGNAGVVDYHDQPVTQQFTKAAPAILHWPWRAAMFKTLFRNNGIYRKIGIHRPKSPDKDRVGDAKWFDCSGRRLPDRFVTKQIFSPFGRDNYGFAQLNHYPLGAMQSYVLKTARGRAVHADDKLGMSYWIERNWCDAEDTSISSLATQTADEKEPLLEIDGWPTCTKSAVAWRGTYFDQLMREEAYRALFGRLLMSSPTRALGIEDARKLYSYARLD